MSSLNTFPAIAVLIALISLVVALRTAGLLKADHGPLFASIVTHITLPATIFYALAHARDLQWDYALVVLFLFVAEVVLLALAWWLGRALKLSRAQLGSFMLASAFGSSALLGYALVGQLFPNNIEALSEAVFISELGVGVGLFTVGTLVAIHFGQQEGQVGSVASSLWVFAKSPIFLSILAGFAYGQLQAPLEGFFFKEVFSAIHLIAQANTFFVILTIGVMLQFHGLGAVIGLATIAILLKLLVSPFLVWLPSLAIPLQDWQQDVMLLEAAMPSALLSVVLAARYGCDAHLASKLVYLTTLVSAGSILLVLGILG